MAILHIVAEEDIGEENVQTYFQRLYRVVCVGERPTSLDYSGGVVRTTYVVDWEQLVHLLEEYSVFGEDIVELAPLSSDEASVMRAGMKTPVMMARA
jgi:hypothetical protein